MSVTALVHERPRRPGELGVEERLEARRTLALGVDPAEQVARDRAVRVDALGGALGPDPRDAELPDRVPLLGEQVLRDDLVRGLPRELRAELGRVETEDGRQQTRRTGRPGDCRVAAGHGPRRERGLVDRERVALDRGGEHRAVRVGDLATRREKGCAREPLGERLRGDRLTAEPLQVHQPSGEDREQHEDDRGQEGLTAPRVARRRSSL
jgi:hypothetical protein